MKTTGIRLQYQFAEGTANPLQTGAAIENPLFDLLASLQEHGSIRHAATALQRSYRHVWGEIKQWEQVLGHPLVVWSQGRRAQMTPFAQRLMWAERQARTRMTPHLEALRIELRRALNDAHDERHRVLDIHASHDLELPRLQALAEAEMLHLGVRFSSSAEALRALNAGLCDLAGFHVPQLPGGSDTFLQALRPLLKPGTHKLIGSHSRRQGLMYPKTSLNAPPLSLRDVAQRGLKFAPRQPGSSTRLLLEHLLAVDQLSTAALRMDPIVVEFTHVAVAAAVASGSADVALGIEAAAAEHGLGFLPLVEEAYFLVCLKASLDTPEIASLRRTLASPEWAQSLATMPGYQPHHPGEVLSLTKALPWWRFARAKRRLDVER